jgi:hypothetical protein
MNKRLRIERLEAAQSTAVGHEAPSTPIELRVFFSTMERVQAREEGRKPRPYTQEEIEHLRRCDLEIAAGGGVVGWLRQSVGWKSVDCQESLDAWRADARRRVEAGKDRLPELWHEVWAGDM